ncbi:hypothetical protein [Jiangella mangrovi]|uniref:Uncharacterized protein n=1 Tax=Jiangella mangrovi TaxID=1524084 RepID=A0A7W9LJU7_9ACTN|nr:hypothetical protein [Jiangella mangrovi]MBB5786404.1 hypothetical protein [Jiangella mangrovi]
MTPTAAPDDATVEAILQHTWIPSGGEGWAELAALSDAVDAIRRSADEAVPPTAELARRIALGDFAGVTPAPPIRPHGVRARLARRYAMMSLRARLVALVAVLFTGVTGVAAAGALPGPAQDGFETVVESVTPIEFDDGAPPSDGAEFGQDVSEDAQDDGVDGQEVSEDAQELGNRPDDPGAGHEPELPDLPTTVPTTPGEHRPDEPGRPEDGDQGQPDEGDQGQDENGQSDEHRPEQGDQGQDDAGRPEQAVPDQAQDDQGDQGEDGDQDGD